MGKYKLVVLSTPKEGCEADFATWSDNHLGDCMKVPGVMAAERFELSGHFGAGSWSSMSLYELVTDNPDGVVAEMFVRLGTDAMPGTDASDTDSVVLMVAKPVAVS